MAGLTLAQAQANLTAANAALLKAMDVAAYTISGGSGSRSKTNQNIDALQRQVEYWDGQVKKLSRGGMRIVGATPC